MAIGSIELIGIFIILLIVGIGLLVRGLIRKFTKKLRFCPKCGLQNDANAKFCSDCGFKFGQ